MIEMEICRFRNKEWVQIGNVVRTCWIAVRWIWVKYVGYERKRGGEGRVDKPSHIPLKKEREKNAHTKHKNCFTVKQGGMHAGSAEYTTFITSELINRKSGIKATRIAVLRKRKEKNNGVNKFR